MSKNDSSKQRSRKLWFVSLAVCLMLAAVLLSPLGSKRLYAARTEAATTAPVPFQAVRSPWTAVGSTGVIDEASANFHAFGSADIGFRAGSPGTLITARYNVTNTFDNNSDPNFPGWTTLEMGSNAPINTIIEARLFRIKTCDFTPELLCIARNRSNDFPCARCSIQTPIDFTSNLYYVEVVLDRTSATTSFPRMFTLRLF
ncbi:MAG TPA: hypothetical protein VK363_11480 [Pyrinomonadaceae bacterium]|nr:hypothetical protein [Pyrinomonadaceae bacterium]